MFHSAGSPNTLAENDRRIKLQDPTLSSKSANLIGKAITISPLAVLLAGFLLHGSLLAQQERTAENESMRASHSGIFPLPVVYYAPETGVAGGAALLYLYRDSSSERGSNLAADIIYTQKKQFVAEIAGDQYFEGGRYRLVTYLSLLRYPNKFFGVGNSTLEENEETYTPQTYLLRIVLYRNLASSVNIGPMIQYENVSMRELVPGGVLAADPLPGSKGGSSVGLGIVANWDSRDNTFAAQSGSFFQVTTAFYRTALGSDYSYDDIQIDMRHFLRVFSDHVVALQGVGEFINGAAPFQSYAKFGGQNLLRGYVDGRYRDKNAVSLQAEYRAPVWWRFGVVGFAGIAQVADRMKVLATDRFWFSGGIGLRYAWSPEERINLRLDYGMGNNSSGIYIKLSEAF